MNEETAAHVMTRTKRGTLVRSRWNIVALLVSSEPSEF